MAKETAGAKEVVVGAEGVPQPIIDAERKAHPLRRFRLAVYALASSAAAAQVGKTSFGLLHEFYDLRTCQAMISHATH